MSAIKGFFYTNKKVLTFLLLIFICIIMMIFSNKEIIIRIKEEGVKIFYPFQFAFHSSGNLFQNTVNSISQLKETKAEIENLKHELEQYKRVIIDFNELNNDNLKLKKVLELKDSIAYDTIASEIIGRDPKSLFDVLIINKGRKDGIDKNMPVISYAAGKRAIVGKIVETSSLTSKVLTLQSPRFYISSVLKNNENRFYTIVQGNNKKSNIARLLYIPKDYQFNENNNDYVYSSGDSLLFPKGIEIGKIIQVYPSKKYEIFKEADIKLSTDFSKLDYVLVLKINYKKDDFNLLEEK